MAPARFSLQKCTGYEGCYMYTKKCNVYKKINSWIRRHYIYVSRLSVNYMITVRKELSRKLSSFVQKDPQTVKEKNNPAIMGLQLRCILSLISFSLCLSRNLWRRYSQRFLCKTDNYILILYILEIGFLCTLWPCHCFFYCWVHPNIVKLALFIPYNSPQRRETGCCFRPKRKHWSFASLFQVWIFLPGLKHFTCMSVPHRHGT